MNSDSSAPAFGTQRPRVCSRLLMLSMVAALAAVTAASARAQECIDVGSQKSTQAGDAVELSFRNASTEGRRLYWLDQNGERKFVALIGSGDVLRQPTTNGHVWIVTDEAEKCLAVVTAGAAPQTIDVGAQAQLVVPAPGVAQPMAPASPPAVDPAPPQAVAAPPVELPQVSPVEQFELSGPQRIAPRSAGTRSLTQQASGAVQLTQVRTPTDSGRWTFVAVPGTPFVRIRSNGKNTHLTDVDGTLRAALSAPDVEGSHWSFEPVDGSTYVQMRNRATDRLLMAVNGAPALVQDYPQDQEALSHWAVSPASSAVAVAPPPQRDAAYEAYEDALDGCRAIGGYWTGSSCRSPVISRPLVCPRGWAWYPEFGECLWEGRCPPWQMGAGGSCLSDLSCKNGRVRLSFRGYPVCDCPPGMKTWGRYPRLACIPSVARIAPLLGAPGAGGGRPVIGGQVIGGPGRLPVRPPNPQIVRPVTPAIVAPAPAANSLSSAAARAAQQKLLAERVKQQNEQRARERRAAAQQAAALRAAKLKAERERAAALRKAAADKVAADKAAAAARLTPVVGPRPVTRPVVKCRPPLIPDRTGRCVPSR